MVDNFSFLLCLCSALVRFREEVVGNTDPGTAKPVSLRGYFYKHWDALLPWQGEVIQCSMVLPPHEVGRPLSSGSACQASLMWGKMRFMDPRAPSRQEEFKSYATSCGATG